MEPHSAHKKGNKNRNRKSQKERKINGDFFAIIIYLSHSFHSYIGIHKEIMKFPHTQYARRNSNKYNNSKKTSTSSWLKFLVGWQ